MPPANYATLWLFLALKPGKNLDSNGKALSPWHTPGWFERFKLGDLPTNSRSKTVGLSKPGDVADFVSALSNIPLGERINYILAGGDGGAGRAAYKAWFRFISRVTNDLIDQIMMDNNTHPQQIMAMDNTNDWPEFPQLAVIVIFAVTEGLYDGAFLRGSFQVEGDVHTTIKSFITFTGTRLKKIWTRSGPLYEQLKENLKQCVAGKCSTCFYYNVPLMKYRVERSRCNSLPKR